MRPCQVAGEETSSVPLRSDANDNALLDAGCTPLPEDE